MIYTDIGSSLRRESDGASIPKDPRNADYSRALAEVAAATSQIVAKPAPTKPEIKATALAGATALGFTLNQCRIISALFLLQTGTPAQKIKAAAILQPFAKLVGDAIAIAAQIDADQVPSALTPAIIPTDDP